MKIGFLDLETQYLFAEVGGRSPENCEKLKVSIAGLAVNRSPVKIFQESEIEEVFQYLDGLDQIVGHNLLGFDYLVLKPYFKMVHEKYSPKTFDIMFELEKKIGRRVSLDDLAQSNLGIRKSADGKKMPEYWRRGNHEEVIKHCEEDVEIIRRLYNCCKISGKLRWPIHGEIAEVEIRILNSG